MPRYVLKILLDLEARDDLEARRNAGALIASTQERLPGVREIVLHAPSDQKSIRLNPDGTCVGQWNRGGPGAPPTPPSPA